MISMMVMTAALTALQEPVRLWQNIEVGMTAEQVTSLYPDARVRREKIEIRNYRPLPNCPSTVVIHMKPVVSTIEVRGAGSLTGGCAEEIQEALKLGYGPADERDYDLGSLGQFFGWQTQTTETHIWATDGVVMRFQRLEDRGLAFPSWTMIYVPREQVDAELDRQRAVGL